MREGTTLGLDPTGANPGRAPVPGDDDSKVPYSGRPVSLQYAAGQTLSQRNKIHPLSISHDNQIPDHVWSRDGPRRSAGSQGMLHSLHEAKSGRQRECRRA